jgi:hypothetical protein
MSASNTNRWKLGLFVTIGTALSIGSLMWLGISQLQRRTTPAYFYFQESVNGLEVGSPIKFLGVEVGRVDDISPAPDRRHIEVRAGIYVDTLEAWGISPSEYENRIEGQSFVSEEIRAQLRTSALTSISFIQLGVFDAEKNPERAFTFPIPWETIPTVPSTFRSLETGLMDALEEWPAIAARAGNILRNIDQGLEELDFRTLNDEATTMMRGVDAMARELKASPIVDSDSPLIAKLAATLDELRGFLAELRGPEGAVEVFVGSVSGAADAIREDFAGSDFPGAVAAVEGAGRGFEGTSREMTLLLEELRASLSLLDATLRSVRGLTDLLARDPAVLLYGRTPQPPFLDK